MQENLKILDNNIQSGNSASESGQYAEAAESFGVAADTCKTILIDLYCSQAHALLSCERYSEAHSSSQEAIRLNGKSSKAWYLSGTALFHMKKFSDAKGSFLKAAELEQVLAVKVTYKDHANRCDEENAKAGAAVSQQGTPVEETAHKVTATRDSTRMQWYQSSKYVNIDIYAKNVVKEESKVLFTEKSLCIHLKRPGLDDYVLEVDLAGEIVPSTSTWNVSRVKVEVRLCKLKASTWKSLDRNMNIVSANVEAAELHEQRVKTTKERQDGWNSFAEKELEDYKEGDSAMELFRSIYKDADEDTRRAMIKSYSESGGQVLSTNWGEVKEKKVVYEEPK